MKKLLFGFILALLLMLSCAAFAEQTTTIMVYMCGSDISDDALEDVLEMQEGVSGDQGRGWSEPGTKAFSPGMESRASFRRASTAVSIWLKTASAISCCRQPSGSSPGSSAKKRNQVRASFLEIFMEAPSFRNVTDSFHFY